MRLLKIFIIVLFISASFVEAFAQDINVFINVRGNTGRETELRAIMTEQFRSFEKVIVTGKKEECHLYLDLSLVEQDPIRFYGLGISIAYKLGEHFYSRPTSDVAQFGEERMKDVCRYLAKEIDKAFLEPLRQPKEELSP